MFPSQFSSFKPLRKEDLKWSMVTPKPRYSEQMENGVLYFGDPVTSQGKRTVFGARMGQKCLGLPQSPKRT